MAAVQFSDRALRLEFAKTVERKGQIFIRFDASMIKCSAAMRLFERARLNGIWDFTKCRVAPFVRIVEIGLRLGMQPGSCHERNSRLREWFCQFRARLRTNCVA